MVADVAMHADDVLGRSARYTLPLMAKADDLSADPPLLGAGKVHKVPGSVVLVAAQSRGTKLAIAGEEEERAYAALGRPTKACAAASGVPMEAMFCPYCSKWHRPRPKAGTETSKALLMVSSSTAVRFCSATSDVSEEKVFSTAR